MASTVFNQISAYFTGQKNGTNTNLNILKIGMIARVVAGETQFKSNENDQVLLTLIERKEFGCE